jgi:Ca-activated chloride channel family protein
MKTTSSTLIVIALLAAAVAGGTAQESPTPAGRSGQEGFRFRSGVELINVTATVIDQDGRFVPGLRKEDFQVFDDNQPVDVTHFSNERVPVSLGIVLDTSGSMTPDKMASARGAIERFMELLGPDDEMFLYRFANVPELAQGWTRDREALSRALRDLYAGGATAMYDAVADALPVASSGRNRKKAIVVISDGNDTSSSTTPRELKELIRESEVLVYAIGVDGRARQYTRSAPRPRFPVPLPIPGGRRPGWPNPIPPIGGGPGGGSGGTFGVAGGDRLDERALRQFTDDTGGRTEVVHDFADLAGATARIADELSKQYYLGYVSPGAKDGRWHAIRVEVRDQRFHVRARRGYVAS